MVETPTFIAAAKKLFSDSEREVIVARIAEDPESGDVMSGTGGFRKVRIGRAGMGKSGGARVIYIYRDAKSPIFLITVFAKNEKANLTKAERNALARRAGGIFGGYGRGRDENIR